MEFKTKKATKYNTEVTIHTEMDTLRKDQCLCFNCKLLGPSGGCKIAEDGFELCVKHNIAFAVTSCPDFQKQEDPTYKGLRVPGAICPFADGIDWFVLPS